ncbi:RHS repeat domain-containing protein [Stenotrophomonas sp. NPDC047960]|uniref:RHS repeat domain-containing protein n=1 Tax=Stenotrophomonas sp. NPDC047960 TaxID=3364531 RepID=UPI00371695F7
MSSTSVHSNAFNFKSYFDHGVDPRTGLYTLSLSVPELKCNGLTGPTFPLSITFNPMNTMDEGFGVGWSMNLTEYRARDHQLSLSNGESFTVTGSGADLGVEEQKLDSFHLHDDGGGQLTVVHRDGRVEVLRTGGSADKARALPVTVMSPEGRRLDIDYVSFRGGQRLSSVREHSGRVLLDVLRPGDSEVELQFFPGAGEDGAPLARYLLTLNGDGWVDKIILPTQEEACWQLAYEVHNDYVHLTELWSPTGSHEVVSYFTGGDEGHRFPGDARPAVPRVTRHLLEPGFGQPPMETRYQYRSTRSHPAGNFLGQGALDDYPDDGRDNLYRASPDFHYGTTIELWADGALQRSVERTFNRFHLQVEEVSTQGNCVTRVTTTHYADTDENRNKPFAEQPPYCQLPKTVVRRWELTDDPTQAREEVEETRFDDHGNLVERITADGVREVNTYYPASGSGQHCPPDPEGFVRSLHTRTRHPAPSEYGNAPTLCSTRTYTALSALDGAHADRFLLEHEDVQVQVDADNREVRRATRTWFEDPADELRLGRARTTVETMNGLSTTTAHDYRAFTNARLGADVLEITETVTGFDGSVQTAVEEHSVLNGNTLRAQTADGAIFEYAYDALGRVTLETVSPGTPFEASRRYVYHLIGETGRSDDQAWQEVINAAQITTRTWFDGLSRAILEECQDVDAAAARGLAPADAAFRTVYRARHNSLDQVVCETHVDWHGETDLELVSQHEYNDWGQRRRTTTPDGVSEIHERSPFGGVGEVQRHWLESASTPPQRSNVEVMWFTLSGKAAKEERQDAEGNAVFTVTRYFDGLGNCVESRDDLGDNEERVTRFDYDVWGRVIGTTLPDGTLVERGYAPHTVDSMPTRLQVTDVEAELPTVLVGEQTFDGLSRLSTRTVGGRREQYLYEGGHPQVHQRITAAGETIEYTYQRSLVDSPQAILSTDDTARFDYHPKSGMVTAAHNDTGSQVYDYSASGQLVAERRLRGEQTVHASHFTASRLGLQMRRLDTGPKGGDVETVSTYNAKGQLVRTTQGGLVARFRYDAFGRLQRTTTDDTISGERVVTRQAYDGFGREIRRSIDAAGQVLEQIQDWRGDNQIARRVQTLDGVVQLEETFTYDLRGRLQIQQCAGDSLPVDRHGNAISMQAFTYDALDNPRMCTTRFAAGGMDRARYTYSSEDPCQLITVTHDHADYALEEYRYDADGNMLNDEQGRTLRYDCLGRLLEVGGGPSGNVLERFHYNGYDHLSSQFDGAGNEIQRFYEGYRLHHEVSAGATLHYLHVDDTPLAEHQADLPGSTRLLLASAIGSVIAELHGQQLLQRVYSAYGESADAGGSHLGYNGERREATGCYLLGNGYRAYNPVLMRFHSPDTLSPFGEGGINTYMYCRGNPVLFRDPSGHYQEGPDYIEEPKQEGRSDFLAWLGVAGSAVMAAISLFSLPWTGGLSVALVAGAVGVLVQAAGVGLQVTGVLKNDNNLYYAGMAAGLVGFATSMSPQMFSGLKNFGGWVKAKFGSGAAAGGKAAAAAAAAGKGAAAAGPGVAASAAAAPAPISLSVRSTGPSPRSSVDLGAGAGAGTGTGAGGASPAVVAPTGTTPPPSPPATPVPQARAEAHQFLRPKLAANADQLENLLAAVRSSNLFRAQRLKHVGPNPVS